MSTYTICYKATYLHQSICAFGYSVKYQLGEKTVPTIGKLFCFSSVGDMQDFLFYLCDRKVKLEVFVGLAENAEKIKRQCELFGDFSLFWKYRKQKKALRNSVLAGKGTTVCDSFIPFRQYSYEEFMQM